MQFNHSQLLKIRHILIGEKDDNLPPGFQLRFGYVMIGLQSKRGYSMKKLMEVVAYGNFT